MPRTMISEVFATASSRVKKLPLRRSCSIRPTFSHARLKIASRSSAKNSGEIEFSYDTGLVSSSGWCSVQVPSGGFGYCLAACFGAFRASLMRRVPPRRSQDHAAVDADHLAGDEARLVGAEERAGRGDVFGGASAADGNHARHELLELQDVAVRFGAAEHRRVDHARWNVVDGDAVGRELERE